MRSASRFVGLAVALASLLFPAWPGQAQEAPAPMVPPDHWAEPVPTSDELAPTVGPVSGPPLRPYVAPKLRPRPRAAGLALMPLPALPPAPEPRFDPEGPVALTIAYPAAGAVLAEGQMVSLVWNTGGQIRSVKVYYEGERCPVGGHPRGRFSERVASTENRGAVRWQVPWMDAIRFRVRVTGYGGSGKPVAQAETAYNLLPAVCQNRPATAICVSKAHQRLYYLRDGVIQRTHVISTAAPGFTTPVMRPGSYDRGRGAMGRVFDKSFAPRSRMYEVVMYYWLAITSAGTHGIHATSRNLYHRLGSRASHGCIRQHRADAQILWNMVSVGTPVYVF
jgi:lipoprotein-anchoring transpeptidase ErfK/SrfK